MKDWNKKKLTALVCAGLMAGTLLPCEIVSAKDVEIKAKVDDGADLPEDAQWVEDNNYNIALLNAGDTLVLDFDGLWDKSFYGGYSDASKISNYHLLLKSGQVRHVYGGFSYGGNATENTVTISGGTLSAGVYGGWSWSGAVTENTVTISGGQVRYVYGGFSALDSATKNTVNLIGLGGTLEGVVSNNQNKPSITGEVCGGSGGTFSGNTLNVYGTGTQVRTISKFDTMNFFAPASTAESMLSATNTVNLGNSKIVLDKEPDYNLTLLHSNAKIDKGEATFWVGDIEVGLSLLAKSAESYVRITKSGFDLIDDNKKLVWDKSKEQEKPAEVKTNGEGIPIREKKLDLLKKFKAQITISIIEKDGKFYAASDVWYKSGGWGGFPTVANDTPYNSEQEAIETEIKKIAAHGEDWHRVLWESGYYIVGDPAAKREEAQLLTESKVDEAVAKFESQGMDALTDCEKCKLTTRCEDCCRTCPPEKHCNVRQCEIESKKEKEQIDREQAEHNAEITARAKKSEPEDEPPAEETETKQPVSPEVYALTTVLNELNALEESYRGAAERHVAMGGDERGRENLIMTAKFFKLLIDKTEIDLFNFKKIDEENRGEA